jgi:hypothetical protein
MGNRAVITTKENFENNGIGVYLHWNGGYDSVSAFLKYCELKGYRTPDTDNYGWARLCQVIGNFFGGSTSLGIDVVNKLDCDNYDNGVYIIKGWEIVDRKHKRYAEQMNYEMEEMLMAIDKAMPEKEQIGEYLKAKEISVEELKVGDTVFIKEYGEKFVKHKVMGFGEDKFVNGTNVKNMPYVDLYGNKDGNYDWNCNNYIYTKTVRIATE